MFVVKDARVSLTFSEVCFTDSPFGTIVSETQGGQTKTMPHTHPAWRRQFILYTSAAP